MKIDYKKLLKVLGTGVGAIAAVKVLQQIIAGFLLDAKVKEKVEKAKQEAAKNKTVFDVTKAGLLPEELTKWVQAQTNALMASAGIVIFMAQKFLKNADLKIAAWAGAGFPVALGLSALVDKTGKLADVLEFQMVRAPEKGSSTGASGGTMSGDDRKAITIPAAALVDFMNARAQAAQTVQGPSQMARLGQQVMDGDRVHKIAASIMSGDGDDDMLADYVTSIEDDEAA